jgi:hypothetical protein
MASTARSFVHVKVASVPKRLGVCRKDASPYHKSSIANRILLNPKRRSIRRGKTFTEKTDEETMACLIKVERNYVKELLNDPLHYKSKSPIPSKKNTCNPSPQKTQRVSQKFETITFSDVLCRTHSRNDSLKRTISSITPDIFLRRK